MTVVSSRLLVALVGLVVVTLVPTASRRAVIRGLDRPGDACRWRLAWQR